MATKRVLYLSSVGGHDFRFLNKLKALEPEWQTLFVTFVPELAEELKATGVETRNLNYNNRPFVDWDRLNDYTFWQRLKLKHHFSYHREALRQIIKEFKPDIVHSGWLQTDSFVAALEKETPLVVAEWGSDIFIRPFDNRRNRRKTVWTLNQADLILCDCQAAVDKLDELLGRHQKPVLNFPWGIERRLFHPGNRSYECQSPLKIVVVKNLVPVSSLHTLLEALEILGRQGAAVEVSMYGDGVLRKQLESESRARGLEDVVRFYGLVDNKTLPEILRRHDLFVSCNLSEGTSLAMMEAMACGLLPVATTIPAYEEWIQDNVNGYLCPPGDASALASTISKIQATDNAKLSKMRHANLELADREFDWDKNFAKLVEGYKKLLA